MVIMVMAPVAGNLVDQFRCAQLLLGAGLATVSGGMFITAGMHAPWQLYLAYSGLAAVGFGMAASHGLDHRQYIVSRGASGLAVRIATSGSTAGQLLVVPRWPTSWKQRAGRRGCQPHNRLPDPWCRLSWFCCGPRGGGQRSAGR